MTGTPKNDVLKAARELVVELVSAADCENIGGGAKVVVPPGTKTTRYSLGLGVMSRTKHWGANLITRSSVLIS